jgi:hypothetical protein
MTFGKRLRALKRALERAALRLRIKWLSLRLSRRRASALTKISFGEGLRDLGRRMNDPALIADGFALMDHGHQELNEIETGHPAEPRPASWWKHRA